IGLVKFDFLGLKTLTLIHDCLGLIEMTRREKIDLNRLTLDDKKTYRLLCDGNTTGVFQLESTGIREMTVKIRPNCFEDLVAILALYRPGPLDSGMAEEYIKRMQFAGYFLVVADFINYAKRSGIPVGPGRGSSAGSLVAYALKITDLDPIRHVLLFERFLNPERRSMPDIDVDFCIRGRAQVIQYVKDKYGADRVAQIATFGTLKAKAAIKDVGRALGFSFAETDAIAKLIPAPKQGFDHPLTDSIKMEPRLQELIKGDARIKNLIDHALRLEGLVRHASTHAAGVVLSNLPLVDHLPLFVDKEGGIVTQFDMGSVEKIGLVKFDFLGLKTLTLIHDCLGLIEMTRREKIDLNRLTLDDKKTYRL
ncbi:MAG TPA: hypothetical protein VII92_20505, partial [Anaerolineae bacterium]